MIPVFASIAVAAARKAFLRRRFVSLGGCSWEPSLVMPRHCYATNRRKHYVRPLRTLQCP
jgi:hypothetical protein